MRKFRKKRVINTIILILVFVIISVIYVFKIFSNKALPQLLSYAEIETKKIVSSVINKTIMNEISRDTKEELFITIKDSNGNIKSIDFNSSEVTNLLYKTTSLVEKNLKYLESGEVDKLNLSNISSDKLKNGIIYEIPSGIIFNNVILNNIFPKIPVKIDLIGNILCKLNTEVVDYGINNALIKVNINVEVEVKILLPFVSDNSKISVDIPIVMKLIEGSVPSYYFDKSPYVSKIVEE